MLSPRRADIVLIGLLMSGAAAAAPAPADCAVPVDKLLRRLELELPGDVRVARDVEIPADAEILVEAFEWNVNARVEIRDAGAEPVVAENALHRWTPHRLIIASGPARKVGITVLGVDRAHGTVDVRLSRLASQPDRRCVEFWRATAAADAAYSRGIAITRGGVDAEPGASKRAYESAVADYSRATRALGTSGFDAAQSRVVLAAALMNSLERFQDAIDAASAAEAQYLVLGDEYGRDLARFHVWYSRIYDAMRTADAAEAKRKYEAARSAFVELAASHLRRGELREYAEALDGVSCASGFLYRYADAIAGYQRELEIFEQLHEPDRAAVMRYNLAYFESQFGRYQEALNNHLAMLEDADHLKDPDAFIYTLRDAAFLELKLGRYDAALAHYSKAYAWGLQSQSTSAQAWGLYGLGNTYHAIGNFGEALNYLERSLALRSEQQRTRDLAITLRALANLLGDMGRGREAIARREEALRNSQIPLEKARITLELIDDRLHVGDVAIAKGLTATLLSTRDLPDPLVHVGATLANARVELADGDGAGAARDARTAADYYRAHELVSSEFEALIVQARAVCVSGARDEALEIAGRALQRAEEIRTFSSNPTLRASLWRPLRPAFGFTIGLLARENACGPPSAADPLGALAIAEASRGRALEDFRFRTSTDSTAQSNAHSRRRELFEQLAGVRQQLETPSNTASGDDERMGLLLSEAARLRREIDLSGGLPESSRRRPEDLRPALRARIDAIPKDVAVVEYWIGKDEAFAWLLTRGRVQLVDLGSSESIDTAARGMYDAMRTWVSGSVETRIARAKALHELIIAPLPAELGRARAVYFIPDGALHAVPFSALTDGAGSDPHFLVDSHDVAVAPAFLALAHDSERLAAPKKAAALVVVDPVYARDDGRFAPAAPKPPRPAAASVTLRGSRAWSRLPGTAREAATISRLLGPNAVQVLSGFDASRDVLLGHDLARYDILHFATHAVADTEAPQLSALILSTLDAKGSPRIGEVFAGDLADQRLNARLVVFSGCETALGRAEAGEGLLGLRYAAHASGAQTVIASLWPVEDAAGARLMDDLYADVISRNASPVAALSRAARAARVRWKDPALWAAFDVSVAKF